MATTITALLMAVLLLNTGLQAVLPNRELEVLISDAPLHPMFAGGKYHGAAPLFDVADVLIGKHPEVEDRHDRSAPIEVRSLLQLREAHSRLALLTTHLNQALDDACERSKKEQHHAPAQPHLYICPPEHQQCASAQAC